MNVGFDASTIALLVGGGLGAFTHATLSKDYSWRSRYTALDTILGLALGILIPVLPLPKLFALLGVDFELPATASLLTPAQKGAGMFFMAYAMIDAVRDRVLGRWQPPPENRRATDQPAPAPPAPIGGGSVKPIIILISLFLPLIAGCATVKGSLEPAGASLPIAEGTVKSPLQVLSAAIGALAENPIFRLAEKDATDTLAWVTGAPDAPTDPLRKFQASQCPQAVLLAVADFRQKAKGFQAALAGIESRLQGASQVSPELILLNTRLQYSTSPLADPKAQVEKIKGEVYARVSAVANSCRNIIPARDLAEAAELAARIMGIAGLP